MFPFMRTVLGNVLSHVGTSHEIFAERLELGKTVIEFFFMREIICNPKYCKLNLPDIFSS